MSYKLFAIVCILIIWLVIASQYFKVNAFHTLSSVIQVWLTNTSTYEKNADNKINSVDFTAHVFTGAHATPTPNPNFTTIQNAVNNASTGSTVVVPPGVYRETVTISKSLTLIGQPGAIIDGRDSNGNVVRASWVDVRSSNVTVKGFEMRYANNKPQTGGIANHRNSDVTFEDLNLHHADGANISLSSAYRVTLRNSKIHQAGQLGLHTWAIKDSLIEGNEIYENNRLNYDTGWEAGALKATELLNVTYRGNRVHHNNGPGMWCDIRCDNVTYDSNIIYWNKSIGLHYEVSARATIINNVIYENGHGSPGWGSGAGIRIANSRHNNIRNNIVAWNGDGIVFTGQNRGDHPGYQDMTGNVVEDNLIVLANPNNVHNTFLLAFVWDTDNLTYGWTHARNRFLHVHPSSPGSLGGPEGWGSNNSTWAKSFESSCSWLTSVDQVRTELQNAGVPLQYVGTQTGWNP